MTSTAILAIRPAVADDAADLARLAALDSTVAPTGPTLLALVDGRALAALELHSGAVVADPFAPTAELVAHLRRRGADLRATAPGAAPSRRRTLRAGRRGSPALA